MVSLSTISLPSAISAVSVAISVAREEAGASVVGRVRYGFMIVV
jgi:hypothetical protein